MSTATDNLHYILRLYYLHAQEYRGCLLTPHRQNFLRGAPFPRNLFFIIVCFKQFLMTLCLRTSCNEGVTGISNIILLHT